MLGEVSAAHFTDEEPGAHEVGWLSQKEAEPELQPRPVCLQSPLPFARLSRA